MTAAVLGPIGDLPSHAHHYARLGWAIFPVNPTDKTPLVSQYQATTDPDTITTWWGRWPTALIGHRLPPDVIVLDIDPRHGGLDTWAALKAEIGALPITRGHVSGRGDRGGHTWWLRPDDQLTIRPLTDWAREHQVGHELAGGRWTSGIDLLHHEHRYTILPPSPHPDTGRPYQWIDGRGPDTAVAPLPQLLVDLLTQPEPDAPPAPPRGTHDPDSIADWYSATHTWAELLTRHGWRLVGGDGNTDRSRWRHPTATSAFSATIRHGCLFVYSPNTPFEVTEPGRPAGYTLFRAWATLEHGGDLTAAARAARVMKDGPAAGPDPLTQLARSTSSTSSASPAAPTESLWLPDLIWDARPTLTHIRDAARARLVAPDAVLAATLCRIAAATPHIVDIPAIIGAPLGLTTYAALVGPPEAGKSAAAAVAAELVPVDRNKVRDRVPIGSGEGFVEILYGMRPDPDDPRKKIRTQTHWAAIFHIDEGAVLTDLGARSGSTLLPTLRTAYTHGTLGNANATLDRRRIIEGHSYVYGVTLGIQPELAAPLLADHTAGTPQRFLWAMATDPDAPDDSPAWPGSLDWTPPTSQQLAAHEAPARGGMRRATLTYDQAIIEEVHADRRAVLRQETTKASHDAHGTLLRLKVAALLGILDGDLVVTREHWELARIICDTSRAVRVSIEHTISIAERQKTHAARERRAQDEVYVETAKQQRQLTGAARSAARGVYECDTHDPAEGCPRRCLQARLSSRSKRELEFDDIADTAIAKGWLTRHGDRFRPGESRPA